MVPPPSGAEEYECGAGDSVYYCECASAGAADYVCFCGWASASV